MMPLHRREALESEVEMREVCRRLRKPTMGEHGRRRVVLYLLIPFANLLAGHAACLLWESINQKRNYDGTLCTMIGLAAFLTFAVGYIGDVPGLMAVSPFIGLIGAFSAVKACFWSAETPAAVPEPASFLVEPIDRKHEFPETIQDYGFDGQWFFLNIIPTYDDTNSIGKVYFASYFRWVGKAREMFFNSCMPDFDLSRTQFYVLTKSFAHEFCQEIQEFQPISVRARSATTTASLLRSSMSFIVGLKS